MVKLADRQDLPKTLPRHSRLGVAFRWTVAGAPVDLEAGGYTARVWVTDHEAVTSGPFPAVVSGQEATYALTAADLDTAVPDGTQARVEIVCVAENGTSTLVSDARAVAVGEWGGADSYTPAGG